eukprot:CAMPEP_0182881572 /NCGR_PEP_ID=MMETSP0034_2-20130328/17256_1 /TAXON_ID=156128 /ORGANISM="Nephroselmis pyriformis, Strain CCMP717" /LENGTH=368 /DNA_ID=CAMNT_0025014605 /DNA_START=20 /DNA_END=1123 /DNA_ORIENTATION=-
MVPDYMRKHPKASWENKNLYTRGEIPELKNGWQLESHRFPIVPYWCLTMKKGADAACYGRLSYHDQHNTVHSYHKPHWHQSLVPFAQRVMTVREKARVQGFPDSFRFLGDLNAQYKQIANAVSPQLAKALGREILTSLATAKYTTATTSVPPVFSPSLRNFREFLEERGEGGLPALTRHQPGEVERPELLPMTYEEVLVAYNTLARNDHSHRYSFKTPFQLLDEVEAYHSWSLEKIVGIRASKGYLEVAGRYRGFGRHEWVDLTVDYKKTVPFNDFLKAFPDETEKVLTGRLKAFCVPDSGCTPDSETEMHPDLVEAQRVHAEWSARFEEDNANDRIPKPRASKRSRATAGAKKGTEEARAMYAGDGK